MDRVCHCTGHLINPGGACCQDVSLGPLETGGVLPFCDACGRLTPPPNGVCPDLHLAGCIMRPLGTVEHPSA